MPEQLLDNDVVTTEAAPQPMPVETPLTFQDEVQSVETCIKGVEGALFEREKENAVRTPREELAYSVLRESIYAETSSRLGGPAALEDAQARGQMVKRVTAEFSQAAEIVNGNRRGEQVAPEDHLWPVVRDLYFTEIILGKSDIAEAQHAMRYVHINLDDPDFMKNHLNEINIALVAKSIDEKRPQEDPPRPGRHYFNNDQDKTLDWLATQLEQRGFTRTEDGLIISPHADLNGLKRYQDDFKDWRDHFDKKDATHRDRLNAADAKDIFELEKARDALKQAELDIDNEENTKNILKEAQAGLAIAEADYNKSRQELDALELREKRPGFWENVGWGGGRLKKAIIAKKAEDSDLDKKYRQAQQALNSARANERMLIEARRTHQQISQDHGGHEALKNNIEGLKNRPKH